MSKEIFKIIKKMRMARGFSQLEIAKKLGVSRTSYIAIEQGKRELSLAEAQKIADVFRDYFGRNREWVDAKL